VHTEETLPLPFLYINWPKIDGNFMASPSWLPSPRFEPRTLAVYRLFPHYLPMFIILCFHESYGLIEELQILHVNPQIDTKNKCSSWLTFGSIVFSPFFENA